MMANPIALVDGNYTTPRGRSVIIRTFAIQGSRIPQKEIRCGGDVCCWPDLPHCHRQMAEVFSRLMTDCDSLGNSVRILNEAEKKALATRLAGARAKRRNP